MLTVYSTPGSPGASTTALHLAAGWASEGREVLFIETDPAGGSLSHSLGIQFTPGSASFVASGLPVQSNHLIDHAQDVLFESLHVMPTPASPTGARGIFHAFAEFAEDLRTISENEMAVIIDGGQVTADTAASGLTTGAAGVVVVCRDNSQLSSLELLRGVVSADPGGDGPAGFAVSIGKSPMSPEEWEENYGLTFCGSVEAVSGMAADLSAYLARSKRKSKKWRASLEQVGESLYAHAQPPVSSRPRARPPEPVQAPGTELAGGADEATPAEAAPDPPAQDAAAHGQPDHLPPAADPQGHGEAPPPAHPPPGAYEQPAAYSPPGTYPPPGAYEQPAAHPPPAYPPPGAYEQPGTYPPPAHPPPGAYEQPPAYPPPGAYEQPGTYPPPGAYEQPPAYPPPGAYEQPGTHPPPGAYEQPPGTYPPPGAYEQPPAYPPPGAYEQPPAYPPPGAYEQPPAYPPPGAYEQPGTHPPPGAYEQPPAYPPPGAYEQPGTHPPPGAYEQPPAQARHPGPAAPQPADADTEAVPRPSIQPTGSFRDWALKLHGADAEDMTADRGG